MPAARNASTQTTSAASAITPISRLRIASTIACCSASRQRRDLLRIVEIARREHLIGRDQAQLLGHEADRDRQQRVEVVDALRRALVIENEDSGEPGVGQGQRLPGADAEPELAAGRRPIPAQRSEEADDAVERGERERSPHGELARAHRGVARRDIERFATK